MKNIQISNKLARRIILKSQLLVSRTDTFRGKEGITQIIDHLGYIQIDTLAVIRRSHHHTLWTRQPDYQEQMLDELQSRERLIFEYWTHAMSYQPMADFRFTLPRKKNLQNPTNKWIKQQFQKYLKLLPVVLERIRQEGPLGSKDFKPPSGIKQGSWWDWNPTKTALELLFWKGDLMIRERRNFQKIYDLTERVLPDYINTTYPTPEELGHFLVRRALLALAVAQEREILKFMQPESSRDSDLQIANKELISNSLKQLIETKVIIPVQLEYFQENTFYTLSETIEEAENISGQNSNLFLLSPFDNLIIQRDRIKRLFEFDYALECYLPPAKRKFGYFTLPILWGENFVGRLDPKANAKKQTFFIHNIVLEENILNRSEFISQFVKKLITLARFNHCKKIKIERSNPAKLKSELNSIISKSWKI
ncbi:MAG: hypothetical protein A2Y94_15265 [Caldithrix sp. RBG_13_44_9]|nr:MAG: hypothetical protein A2Y94_15265 [Caldithrix sp. RBG_13_44_9]